MRYPYERFLCFLVSRKASLDESMERYGLPKPGMLWEHAHRTALREGAPHGLIAYWDSDEPALIRRAGVLDWAESQGIRCLWEIQPEFGGGAPSPELDVALRLFVNPHSRAVLGLVLLSRCSTEAAIEIIANRFDVDVDAGALELYQDLFWDPRLVPRGEWARLTQTFRTPEERHLITQGLGSPKEDTVRDLLDEDGVMDHNQIVDDILRRSHRNFKLAADSPNPMQADAIRWAELAIKAINTGKGTLAPGDLEPGATNFSGLFSVQVQKSSHPTLADLQGHVDMPKDDKETG